MKKLKELTGPADTMKNAKEVVFVDLPSLVNCQFIDAFVSIHAVKMRNAGKMKEEMEVRKKPLRISSALDLKNAVVCIRVLVVDMISCNESELRVLDFTPFRYLRELRVGDRCFRYVEEMKLIGLSQLERVEIGKQCFVDYDNWTYGNSNGHFYLKGCESLRELKIGCQSFLGYVVCDIENNASLEVIEMGIVNEYSATFVFASLELKSDSERMR